ncbi:hypothetical protein RFI_19114 [Reticulomyxa filosa]|uniref:Uncharacterized protein n=1 Tax=Reticulomyxa filosa TaxID=46433 RepID=X6MVZ2_RETFI|nr:hypothetical protein RFI_19114 [Reticulomyxa filosa]|eukprot:ETO18168.1 hypothetical protein RFI_19114 [Reticulomyxa filosa]
MSVALHMQTQSQSEPRLQSQMQAQMQQQPQQQPQQPQQQPQQQQQQQSPFQVGGSETFVPSYLYAPGSSSQVAPIVTLPHPNIAMAASASSSPSSTTTRTMADHTISSHSSAAYIGFNAANALPLASVDHFAVPPTHTVNPTFQSNINPTYGTYTALSTTSPHIDHSSAALLSGNFFFFLKKIKKLSFIEIIFLFYF